MLALATALCLEVTESSVIADQAGARRALESVKDLGVCIAIDDFGTGYATLAYLKAFPIDNIKIDRLFVTDVPTSPEDPAIVRAILRMASELSLQVVAEGVENDAQERALHRAGGPHRPGFPLRPAPAGVRGYQPFCPEGRAVALPLAPAASVASACR